MNRLHGLIAEFLAVLFGRRASAGLSEEIAVEIVGYGRMTAKYRPGPVIVVVPELALRLRESSRHVRQSLELLEKQGLARRTPDKNCWKLTA